MDSLFGNAQQLQLQYFAALLSSLERIGARCVSCQSQLFDCQLFDFIDFFLLQRNLILFLFRIRSLGCSRAFLQRCCCRSLSLSLENCAICKSLSWPIVVLQTFFSMWQKRNFFYFRRLLPLWMNRQFLGISTTLFFLLLLRSFLCLLLLLLRNFLS